MKSTIDWIYDKKWWFLGGVVLIGGVLIYVNRDKEKAMAKELFGGQKWFDESLKWYRDNNTKGIVSKLHPQFREKVKEFFSRVEKELGLQMYATSGYRTFEEQAILKRNNKNNAEAGFSDHNYGFAIDVNVIDPKTGKIILKKANTSKDWENSGVVKISKEMGFNWGGGGAFGSYHDPVHFYEKPKGLSTASMRELHNSGKIDSNGYVII